MGSDGCNEIGQDDSALKRLVSLINLSSVSKVMIPSLVTKSPQGHGGMNDRQNPLRPAPCPYECEAK
jgi:hypothetical protein